MGFWRRGPKPPSELPWPPRAAPGTLPAAGQSEVAGIALPQGSVRTADEDFAHRAGDPVLWVADELTRNGAELWKRLSAEFASTGLWPLMLESASHDVERPWLCGEFEGPAEPKDAGNVAGVLADWWSCCVPVEEEAAEGDDSLAPYGPSFPGLAASSVGDMDMTVPGRVVDRMRKTRLGLVPASRPSDAMSAIGWMGTINYDLDMAALALVLASWEDRFGAVLVGLGFDTMTLAVCRPPGTPAAALPIAAEHFAVCPDNVHQGSGSVEAYAGEIAGSGLWVFWWD